MASPDGNSILNSSFSSSPRPIRAPSDHSPVRHRLSTSTAPNSSPPDDHRPRLSPTLSRQYNNPHDPQLRERQRTMDADMAIQLSRARSNTVTGTGSSPVISPVSPIASIPRRASDDLPGSEPLAFSFQEERDLETARTGGPPDDMIAPSPAPELPQQPLRTDMHLNHLSAGHDPTLLVTLQQDAAQDAEGDALGGLPMYQASVGSPGPERPMYDFDHMEIFAREEKVRLGIQTPAHPGTNGFDFHASSPNPGGEGTSLDGVPRTRHRKLSQSSPHPRRGKMALFEQPGGAPPPALAARAPHLLGHYTTPLSAVPSYEQLPGAGQNGFVGGGNGVPIPGASTSAAGQGHDRPYRFSFYSNALSATIHARSLSELPAEGQTFEDMFLGRPGSSHSTGTTPTANLTSRGGSGGTSPAPGSGIAKSAGINGRFGLIGPASQSPENCTWWLDVLSPTDEEMKLLSKVFNIHPLTTEDIQMEETREKIELFRNYYLVCFRGFDQDPYSPTHLEPLNMYIIVFREGILSFHFRPTPHPQNVRRRIKQLKDYISVTSDWISYALIDDITDAFGPLIQGIEYEVDSIDELVLILKEAEQSDMLRRIGTCRKKVMGLLRLMGNKADVVKGLAKRCNENWRVAPTSDIGLYLSDIQDHLITMTQNLNHYEKILSRSHSNYLAQISIEMTDANNQINDVLSKLTALGTVLIPMNLVTGLWGMNVHVPGQNASGFAWFGSIIGALAAFALIAGYSTYKLMVRR